MGWPYEVYAWTKVFSNTPGIGAYDYVKIYEGKSFFKALLIMRRAKKWSGCVKLEWR